MSSMFQDKMKTKNNIKQKILDSISYARNELKYTLISDDWGSVERKCACALGCVLVKDSPEDDSHLGSTSLACASTALLLGVDEKWIDSFIEGFDGNGTSKDSAVAAAWDMGREIALETKPIEYHKWDGEYHG